MEDGRSYDYDLQGRPTNHYQKGIIIKNGKKIVQ
jgi:hypothetical protein